MTERIGPITISAVLFQEGDWWSAQCLEYDIAAQAKTLPALYDELERVLAAHITVSLELDKEPFAGFNPAPKKFWDMYRDAKLWLEGDRLPFRLPKPTSIFPLMPDLRIAELQTANI